jgi:cytochrome c-type biogenesis protein CcmH
MNALRGLVFALVLGALACVEARGAPAAFDARLKHLEGELRCLVCQNQTLADSNASLADDLRREVRTLAEGGMSDDDIKSYLVARYGDFVLYRPPVKPVTYLLWMGPFALLLGGAAVAWRVVSRRRRTSSSDPDPGALVHARALLDAKEPTEVDTTEAGRR